MKLTLQDSKFLEKNGQRAILALIKWLNKYYPGKDHNLDVGNAVVDMDSFGIMLRENYRAIKKKSKKKTKN